ncbi:predicted RNA binding protein YcfA, dsRBD-like fold, HicA-like mRNA interferase family [Thermodesulfovibrio aggregans]|uniref:Predicted RNA binding protein YcfA, dsRBD-like fold, HicA-like mRNA interferase family n=1 Tax=Thermodesulfovibrio aggregans TaxID=86166 RepID=A0A0U9HVZ9_9BACT|nr:type II toxin-antitoxin system HicA family toxin [Thermodesulfovibrio aggregans]GAQ94607.1 predicted RNA binding protein YcfA, dsRBD-like fold, HicA-like mRNA interferase family [Thermodesulfovibrio aggregans]
MSKRIPRVTANEVIRVLETMGFTLSRQSGSHKIYKNKNGQRVTVPYHSGKILHPKVLSNILKDAELTVEKFKKLLNKTKGGAV